MEQSKDVQLAYEIADILDDRKSIDWHIGNSKRYSESFLREQLHKVLTDPKTRNRVRYYNYLVQLHGKHSRD